MLPSCFSGGGQGDRSGSFSAVVVDYDALNPATLRIHVETTNDGTKRGRASCSIDAHDPGRSYEATDLVQTDPIRPGETDRWFADVTVTNEGAKYITNVKVKC